MADNPNPTEDLGYAFLQRVAASARAIWRHQPHKDIGVDGLIEVERRDGASAYIAVQVKTGKSYFARMHADKVRIYLQDGLRRLHRLALPVIIVAYDPEKDFGCWENIQLYVSDHPGALDSGYIDIPLQKRFDSGAIDALRRETRVIVTPVLPKEEVASFLKINTRINLAAFVLLAQHVVNRSAHGFRAGVPPVEFLAGEGLVDSTSGELSVTPLLGPTEKGVRYVQFLLGDRYFVPWVLFEPGRRISEQEIYACMYLREHLAAAAGWEWRAR